MKFRTIDLEEALFLSKNETDEETGITFIKTQIVGERRWETDKLFILKFQDKYYQANYSIGNTENQDNGYFGGEEEIECDEVEPYQVTVTKYRIKQ